MTNASAGRQVGVVGGGTMGAGIAVVMLRAGHRVVLRDVDDDAVAAALGRVRAFIDRGVELGKTSPEDRDAAVARLTGTTKLHDLAEADVVVEAIVEDQEAKARLFADLDDICQQDTLFHTNTSTLSVTGIAAGSRLASRVVGTHYCNPAPLMKLVEVVKARQTSEESYTRTVDFVRGLGKTAVTTADTPGFIVNRFLIPFENSCIRALAAGEGTVESIDTAMERGLRHPMGPFRLLDIVGLDVHRAVAMSLYEQLRDPRFAPPPLVEQMISAGDLGRKAGRGFYTYDRAAHFGT